ncbi:class I SAM-dependent methyltransferase [Aciduricibacillus chroicocephali]|uniref:Class I SAM-dependent methyltransferase n=1 Tax=Aciduricibacillus chroicocephali TaxID=3054939 RepID=A0ABY9KXF4_9BACI|nr:class I SAM-dependent methyltransferase [Bacillaceae bacterium 44XB]
MRKWFPSIYDKVMNPIERRAFYSIRKQLIGKAEGKVLEIGAGSGVNFPYYKKAQEVHAIEPNMYMQKRAVNKLQSAAIPIHFYEASAEKLPFADNSFDTVVATLVFCTIPDVLKAFKEIEKVSKPDATLLLFEHVRMSEKPFLAKLQDVLTPGWKRVCDGCHLNREPLELLQQTRFLVKEPIYYFGGLFVTVEATNSKECSK